MLSIENRNLLLVSQVPYLKPQDPVLGHNRTVGANVITLLLDKMSELPTNQTKKFQKS